MDPSCRVLALPFLVNYDRIRIQIFVNLVGFYALAAQSMKTHHHIKFFFALVNTMGGGQNPLLVDQGSSAEGIRAPRVFQSHLPGVSGLDDGLTADYFLVDGFLPPLEN